MVLTDGWEGRGVSDRIQRRARVLLTGVPGTRAYQQAIADLYEVRSGFVHHGASGHSVDVLMVRRAYVLLFCTLAEALPDVSANSPHPVRDVCGQWGKVGPCEHLSRGRRVFTPAAKE